MSVGIIGNGFVGSAIASGFSSFCGVKIFDKDEKRSLNSLQEVLDQEFVFVCVPTPMSIENAGKCDASIIESVFKESSSYNPNCTFIIKSTVPIGTTLSLSNKYPNLNIIHSPEFLTAKNAKLDFITCSRNVFGYTRDPSDVSSVVNLFENRFPGVPNFTMNSNSSECVKYIANCFFSVKIAFFNEMNLLIDKLDLDYNEIIKGVISDGRIGRTHYEVPGHDGKNGFGGTCFPKDINSLINIMSDFDLDPMILKAAWATNLKVRPEKDWEQYSAAVSSGKKDFKS